MKFNSWKSRQQFYNARSKYFNNSKRKQGQHLFSVSVDLTRRRYLLLNKAKRLIKDWESINYVFADINCSLGMKFQNGVFKYFNSENELHCLIDNWIIRSSHWNIHLRPILDAVEIISARLGSVWHAFVLDEENIAVLKQLCWWYLIKDNFKVKENINNNLSN